MHTTIIRSTFPATGECLTSAIRSFQRTIVLRHRPRPRIPADGTILPRPPSNTVQDTWEAREIESVRDSVQRNHGEPLLSNASGCRGFSLLVGRAVRTPGHPRGKPLLPRRAVYTGQTPFYPCKSANRSYRLECHRAIALKLCPHGALHSA
jgi:hypothetical protein